MLSILFQFVWVSLKPRSMEQKPNPVVSGDPETAGNIDDQSDACLSICCCCFCFPVAIVLWAFGAGGLFFAASVGGATAVGEKKRRANASLEGATSKSAPLDSRPGPAQISSQISQKISTSSVSSQESASVLGSLSRGSQPVKPGTSALTRQSEDT
eukprot:NODE_309_length_11266_cov_0.459479.p7 type:complete len:156 gc:universal NODE_309_length_11266_cov_0.459479:2673-2206(-)